MTYLRINPWKNFETAARKMNQFANEMEKGVTFSVGGFNPRADIIEDEKNYYLILDIAGVAKEDVKISVDEERTLIIKGVKKGQEQKDSLTYLRTERTFGEFERSFILPDNLEMEKIKAAFKDGVLEVQLPKAEPPAPKEININID